MPNAKWGACNNGNNNRMGALYMLMYTIVNSRDSID